MRIANPLHAPYDHSTVTIDAVHNDIHDETLSGRLFKLKVYEPTPSFLIARTYSQLVHLIKRMKSDPNVKIVFERSELIIALSQLEHVSYKASVKHLF